MFTSVSLASVVMLSESLMGEQMLQLGYSSCPANVWQPPSWQMARLGVMPPNCIAFAITSSMQQKQLKPAKHVLMRNCKYSQEPYAMYW